MKMLKNVYRKRIVEKIQTQDCDASDNVNDWCVEQFLEAEMGHCILPWKTANHTRKLRKRNVKIPPGFVCFALSLSAL